MRAAAVRVIALVGVVGLAWVGCRDATFSTSTIPTGILTVLGRSEAGHYVVRPEAAFAFAGTAPSGDSRSTLDTCQAGEFGPQGGGFPEQLDAGDSILFVLGSDTTVLRPTDHGGLIVYGSDPQDLEFVPGDAISFTIPGADGGFPAATISSRTAPVLTSLTPIPAQPSLDQSLTLTWEPVGDDSSRFELQLLYATPGAQDFDQRVVCGWRDDGTGTIRSELLAGWITSEVHRIEVTRYRTRLLTLGDTVVYLLATFDTVPPVVQ